MGWLWWVLVAVLLGGVVWWLANRSQDEPASTGTGARVDDETGSGVFGGAGVAGAGTAGAADTAAPSADPDPAAAGVAAPSETSAPVTPEATGAALDDAGWAPAGSPASADQAAAEADVEVPSDAAAGASGASTTAAENAGWAPVDESPDASTSGAAPADANASAPAEGVWAQDQADVTAEGETPVVSEASGAAAEDVPPVGSTLSPADAPGGQETAEADSGDGIGAGTAVAAGGAVAGGAVVAGAASGSEESADVDATAAAPAGARADAPSDGAWAQNQSDLTAEGEAPVVSEASGAAAEDVAPATGGLSASGADSGWTPGHPVTESHPVDAASVDQPVTATDAAASEAESGSTDIEFADASVAYQEPEADPSYTPMHLAPTGTSDAQSAQTQVPDSQVRSARDTSVDPAASPEVTPAPETGAGEGFGGAAVGGTAEVSEGRYGPGSAEPLADGSAPGAAYTVKGNVESMRFHGPESPYYNRTTAEVWFTDPDAARRAGFTPWNEI